MQLLVVLVEVQHAKTLHESTMVGQMATDVLPQMGIGRRFRVKDAIGIARWREKIDGP